MNFPWKTTQTVQHHFHGGREVLCLELEQPLGDLPVAVHMRELVHRLENFAVNAYLPRATDALHLAVGQHQLHRFVRYCYRVRLSCQAVQHRIRVTLTVTLTAGADLLFCKELQTDWTQDGTLQLSHTHKKPHNVIKKRRNA